MTRGVRFEVVSGPGARQRVVVDGDLVIGREGPEEGRLGGDRALSRRHARLSVFGGGERLLVEDLGSTNGTFVNGERVEKPTVVGVEDTVGLGDSVLRVVRPEPPAAERPGRPAGAVHAVPTNLLSILIARTPVPSDWIVRGALRAIPIVIAVNFVIRTLAVEYFDVSSDIPSMEAPVLLGLSIGPVIGSSLFFWIDFGRRPRNRSILIYLIPGLSFSAIACAVEVVAVPAGAGFREYLATVLVSAVAPSTVMPTMIGLRAKARMRTAAELQRDGGARGKRAGAGS